MGFPLVTLEDDSKHPVQPLETAPKAQALLLLPQPNPSPQTHRAAQQQCGWARCFSHTATSGYRQCYRDLYFGFQKV